MGAKSCLVAVLTALFTLRPSDGRMLGPWDNYTTIYHPQLRNDIYTNPVLPNIQLADPVVMRYKGMYYMYATGDVHKSDLPTNEDFSDQYYLSPKGNALTDHGYRVFLSTDLVNWKRGPVVFDPPDRLPFAWAPHVFYDKRSESFYLYYSLSTRVGVARASSPYGPFKHVSVLIPNAIDAFVLEDGNDLYLYYVNLPSSEISVHKMSSPTELDADASPVLVIAHEGIPWEMHGGEINEAPWVFEKNGTYYLLYSGSYFYLEDYAIGYATSSSPLGPFERSPDNPIMHKSETVFGPGHLAITTDDAGDMWVLYHQKMERRPTYTGEDRRICIDKLRVSADGRLLVNATRESLPAPFINPSKTQSGLFRNSMFVEEHIEVRLS